MQLLLIFIADSDIDCESNILEDIDCDISASVVIVKVDRKIGL